MHVNRMNTWFIFCCYQKKNKAASKHHAFSSSRFCGSTKLVLCKKFTVKVFGDSVPFQSSQSSAKLTW